MRFTSPKQMLTSFVLILFLLSFFKIFIRLQTTMLGYDIGRLKNKEASLLKQKSYLTMELAKITTKQNLETMLSHAKESK